MGGKPSKDQIVNNIQNTISKSIITSSTEAMNQAINKQLIDAKCDIVAIQGLCEPLKEYPDDYLTCVETCTALCKSNNLDMNSTIMLSSTNTVDTTIIDTTMIDLKTKLEQDYSANVDKQDITNISNTLVQNITNINNTLDTLANSSQQITLDNYSVAFVTMDSAVNVIITNVLKQDVLNEQIVKVATDISQKGSGSGSGLLTFFIVLIVLLVISAICYFVYNKYMKSKSGDVK